MLKVEAVDGDKGINDPVIYSISSENGVSPGQGWARAGVRAPSEPLEQLFQLFHLSPRLPDSTRPGWFDIGADGVIRVNGSLDREQLLEEDEEVQLQVTVSKGPTTLVRILLSNLWLLISLSTGSLTSDL